MIQRRKEQREKDTVDKMLGSDSDSDDDDDDDDDEDRAGAGDSGGGGSMKMGGGGPTSDRVLSRARPKATRAADVQSSFPASLDDLLDDQPGPGAGAAFLAGGGKAGRGGLGVEAKAASGKMGGGGMKAVAGGARRSAVGGAAAAGAGAMAADATRADDEDEDYKVQVSRQIHLCIVMHGCILTLGYLCLLRDISTQQVTYGVIVFIVLH